MLASLESSLADYIPLWRTLRESDVTALITPALDYVGALELGSVDVRYASPDVRATLGEGLRTLVASLEDKTTLHFLYRVATDSEADIRAYETAAAAAEPAALRQYVADRVRWLRQQSLRRTSIYLFFSGPDSAASSRGPLGAPMVFRSVARLSREAHEGRLAALKQLRERLATRLNQLGVPSRELAPADVHALYYELLNPQRARQRRFTAQLAPRDNVYDERFLRQHPEAREYTEAEQLLFEDFEDARGYFRQAARVRRVLTLKVLPESGTTPFIADPLFTLATGPEGESRPFPYTLSVTLHVQHQAKTRTSLNVQHGLVEAIQRRLPFLADTSVAARTADAAKTHSIAALFAELQAMSSKLVALSVSLLLEAESLPELDARTDAAHAAVQTIGQSQFLAEEVSQLPAFLSMLPGSGRYQHRRKGCTSRNAADFLPLFAPWRGTQRASSLMVTPGGDAFRLDLFDRVIAPASHGLVVADTGSGKSVALGALTLDALASGVDAILLDNGGSWRQLTELLGGTYLPIDTHTSICPFVPYPEMLDPTTHELDNDAVQDVVSFLEVCVTEPGQHGFDRLQTDVVARAVRQAYADLRDRPEERPLIGRFRDALAGYTSNCADDHAIAAAVAHRLRIFCDGLYADLLNRPSQLRFDSRLLTFDLQRVSKSPTTKAISTATVLQAITNRAAARKRETLVEVDEGHETLGADDVGERFFGNSYRKMRKCKVGMWMISQRFSDFTNSKAGPAIIGNSTLKIFLRHAAGHDEVVRYFGLSPKTADAFRNLGRRHGHYSDFLLLYGTHASVVRLALAPLAYWILTTDPRDLDLLARAAVKNPGIDRLSLLEHLASRYPHGATCL